MHFSVDDKEERKEIFEAESPGEKYKGSVVVKNNYSGTKFVPLWCIRRSHTTFQFLALLNIKRSGRTSNDVGGKQKRVGRQNAKRTRRKKSGSKQIRLSGRLSGHVGLHVVSRLANLSTARYIRAEYNDSCATTRPYFGKVDQTFQVWPYVRMIAS